MPTKIYNNPLMYLRGYEAIEMEIELIKGRDKVSLFVPKLLDLRSKRI